ncbi:UDP-N-acetylglucosamine 2-epimerase (non-hydrolyzing) [Taibaiella lutea]|uniref:UDP-N-acetylglucosamine 2-epimerase (Non-hydrolyzing) n=1 Tax=Taibaiella lutea TaxID=2608001 RepID=A0A5M6CU43_9BACT|nr:UDP-N-acetylglucosamine 2-epimerase (non-hydrolyzing) [Taibaiella lutea]
MKIISVVGARPNFMKIAPFIHAINRYNAINEDRIEHILVHTGQHYDDRMSKTFFESLNIPDADINLGIGSGTHAEQVGNTMIAFEQVLLEEMPDWVVVLGDVNATLACSVTAKKLKIKVCHIEAGLRSMDMDMPEEINRLVTDRLSDLLLTPDKMAVDNLVKEGVQAKNIEFVGNIMIDTLEEHREQASKIKIEDIIRENKINDTEYQDALKKEFAVVTLHRPSNVDNEKVFVALVNFLLNEVTTQMEIAWAVHPRAEKQLKAFGLWNKLISNKRTVLLHPLAYHDMLRLNMGAKLMLTDSGGLQEECTVLGTPCLTMRWNTERPVTLKEHGGLSVLVGNNIDRIRKEFEVVYNTQTQPVFPELWDGKTAERCLNAILRFEM